MSGLFDGVFSMSGTEQATDRQIIEEANKLHTTYLNMRLKYFTWFATFNGALFYFYLQTNSRPVSVVVAVAALVITSTLGILDFRAAQAVFFTVRSAHEAEQRLGIQNGINTCLFDRASKASLYRYLVRGLLALLLLSWFTLAALAIGGITGKSLAGSL